MEDKRLSLLSSENISKAIFKLSIPIVMGMMIQVLYNLVDTYFIGMIGDEKQLAAANMGFPVFILLMAIANIIGTGAASYISRLLGKKDYEEGNKTISISVMLTVIISMIVTIFGVLFIEPITKGLGATGEVYNYTYQYIIILLLGAITVIGSFTLGQLLRAEGNMMKFVKGMLIGTILNIILDPIFIFTFKLGIQGAAIATVIGYLASTIYYLYVFLKGDTILKINLKYMNFDKRVLAEIFKIGTPASLSQMLMGVANVLANNIAIGYGTVTVAGMGVAMKVMMIGTFIFMGFAAGCQPLIGFNYGSGNIERVKETIKKGVTITTLIGIVLAIVFYIIAPSIINIFINQQDVVDKGSVILRALLISLPILGAQMIGTISAQALGKAVISTILSISRQGILYMPLLIILNSAFGFNGLIYAQPLTDIIMAIFSLSLIWSTLSKEELKGLTISTSLKIEK